MKVLTVLSARQNIQLVHRMTCSVDQFMAADLVTGVGLGGRDGVHESDGETGGERTGGDEPAEHPRPPRVHVLLQGRNEPDITPRKAEPD